MEWEYPQETLYVTERITYAAPRRRPWLQEPEIEEKARLSCVVPCSKEARELDAACCSVRSRKGKKRDGRGNVWERTMSSDMVDVDWDTSSPLVGRYVAFTRHGLSPPASTTPSDTAPFYSVASPGPSSGAVPSRNVSRGSSGTCSGGGGGGGGIGTRSQSTNSVFGSRPGSESWIRDVTDFKAILRAGIDVTKRRPSPPAVPPPEPELAKGGAGAAAAPVGGGATAAAAAAAGAASSAGRWMTLRGMLGGGGANGAPLGDAYEGLVTLFLDAEGTMLCWAAPGSLVLLPDPRHCIELADIIDIELVEEEGLSSAGGGNGGSGGSPVHTGVAGRITVLVRRAPHSLVMDVEHDYIYQILARGFASLLNKIQEAGGAGCGGGGAGVDE